MCCVRMPIIYRKRIGARSINSISGFSININWLLAIDKKPVGKAFSIATRARVCSSSVERK